MMIVTFSPARRRQALKVLRAKRRNLGDLSATAQVLYALSLLSCGDDGVVLKVDIQAALSDPFAVQAAQQLLEEALG